MNGSLTVSPAALTIKADNKTKETCAPDPTYTVTPTGLLCGDLLTGFTGTLAFTRPAGEVVGPYTITASGLTNPNYTITWQTGTLNIVPATDYKLYLTISGMGNVEIRKQDASIAGLINGPVLPQVTGTMWNQSITGGFSYNELISVLATPAAGWVFDGFYNEADVKISSGASITATVLMDCHKQVTAKFKKLVYQSDITFGVTPATKQYDGSTALASGQTASATFNNGSKVYPAHTVNVTYTGPAYTSKDVPAGTVPAGTVLFTNVALSGADAQFYFLVHNTGTAAASITAKPLTVSSTATNREYVKGNFNVAITSPTIAGGFIGTESIAVTVAGNTGTMATDIAGTGKSVSVNYTLTPAAGTLLSNYSITYTPVTVNITPKMLTMTGIVVADLVFDGTTVATTANFAGASLVGIFTQPSPPADVVTFSATGATAVFTSATVGNAKTVHITGITLGGAAAGNYTLQNPVVAIGNIVPPPYAEFTPTYAIGRSVNPVAAVPINTPLAINFSVPVFDVNGEPFGTTGLGDVVKLERWDGSTWVNVVVSSVTRVNNVFTVTPVGNLLYSTTYRLRFLNIYTVAGVSGTTANEMKWTLDRNTALPGNAAAVNALVQGKEVQFTTRNDSPMVTPYGAGIAVCTPVMTLEFARPVEFMNGQQITDPSHKFTLQRNVGGVWVDVPADRWSVTVDVPGNPRLFTFNITGQLDYGRQYRWRNNIGLDNNYGFREKVFPFTVWLGAEGAFNHQLGTDGWLFTTVTSYPFRVDVEPFIVSPEYGTRFPSNSTNLIGRVQPDVLVNSTPIISYPAVATTVHPSGYNITKNTGPYNVTFSGNAADNQVAMTLEAVNGYGYRWVRWWRSTTGLTGTYTSLANTAPTTSPVNGMNWFGQTFPMLYANEVNNLCTNQIVYKAEFTRKDYNIVVTTTGAGSGTVEGAGAKLHGETVALVAKPAAGSYFAGWTFSFTQTGDPTPVNVTIPVANLLDPTVAPYGTLTWDLVGNILGNTSGAPWPRVFNVTAQFLPFKPNVYVAVDPNGLTGGINTEWQQTTNWNIDSYNPSVTHTDGLAYKHYIFSNTLPQGALTVAPTASTATDCYVFQKWVYWNPNVGTGGSWVDLSTNPTTQVLNINANWRIKAVYIKKPIVVTVAPLVAADATVVVDFGTTQVINGVPSNVTYNMGDVITITVYPKDKHVAYGFRNATGTNVTAVNLVQQLPDRSIWNYTVTCSDIVLRPVIGLKRFGVTVSTTDVNPTIYWEFLGKVNGSTPAYNVPTGSAYGFAYGAMPEGHAATTTAFGALGFRFSDTYGGPTPNEFVSATSWFEIDQQANFNAVANTGYRVWRYSINGGSWVDLTPDFGTNAPAAFTLTRTITANTSVVFEFAPAVAPVPTYAFTRSVSAAGGGVAGGTANGNYAAGTAISASATPDLGYEFVNWTVTGITGTTTSTANPYNFNMPANAVTVVANFKKIDYTVVLVPRTYRTNTSSVPYVTEPYDTNLVGGDVTNLTSGTTFTFGQVVQLRAVPRAGFRFIGWMVGDIINPTTQNYLQGVQIPDALNQVREFGQQHEITYLIPPQSGSQVRIYAVFAEWGTLATNKVPYYTLTTVASPSHRGVTFGGGTFVHGTRAKVSQSANPGYVFDGWVGGTVGAGDLVNMNSAKTATASFVPINYTLNVNVVGPAGAVAPVTRNYTIEDASFLVSATVPASTPTYTYAFDGWFTDAACTNALRDAAGAVIGTNLQFFYNTQAIPATGTVVNIYAKFTQTFRKYTIQLAVRSFNPLTNATVADAGAGTVSIVGATAPFEFNYAQNIVLQTATIPANGGGYTFKYWTNAAGTPMIWNMVSNWSVLQSETLFAVYQKVPFTVTVAAAPTAGGTVSGGGTYVIGDNISLVAVPAVGYTFAGWFEGTTLVSNNATHTLTNVPFGARNFEARFTLNQHALVVNVVGSGTVTVNGNAYTSGTTMNFAYGTTVALAASPAGIFQGYTGGLVSTSATANVVMSENRTITATFGACSAVAVPTVTTTAKQATVNVVSVTGIEWRMKLSTAATWSGWAAVPANKLITGLTPGATYNLELRTNCGNNVFSASTAVNFTMKQLGDVNCDGVLDVLDITTIVNHIMNVVPTGGWPTCVLDGVDVNSDGTVNVLDIVALVNRIMGLKGGSTMASADIYLETDMIRFNSEGNVAALQFELKGANLANVKLRSSIDGFNLVYKTDGTTLTGILFSADGELLPAGTIDLMSYTGSSLLSWGEVLGSNGAARRVEINRLGSVKGEFALSVFPNPARERMSVNFRVPVDANVNLRLLDLTGRVMANITDANYTRADHRIDVSNTNLKPGLYILQMTATPENGKSFRSEVKVVIIK